MSVTFGEAEREEDLGDVFGGYDVVAAEARDEASHETRRASRIRRRVGYDDSLEQLESEELVGLGDGCEVKLSDLERFLESGGDRKRRRRGRSGRKSDGGWSLVSVMRETPLSEALRGGG